MDRVDSAVRDWLYRDVLGSPAGGGVLRIDDKEDQPPFRFTGKLDKLTIKLKPRKISAEGQKAKGDAAGPPPKERLAVFVSPAAA